MSEINKEKECISFSTHCLILLCGAGVVLAASRVQELHQEHLASSSSPTVQTLRAGYIQEVSSPMECNLFLFLHEI